jgi:hypothetical protein
MLFEDGVCSQDEPLASCTNNIENASVEAVETRIRVIPACERKRAKVHAFDKK